MIIVPFAGLDMYGILHIISQKDFVKAMIKLLDAYLNLAREQSKKHGQIANQVTIIFDLDGFNIKQFLWKPGKNIYAYYPRGETRLIVEHPVAFFSILLVRIIAAGELVITFIQMYEANYPEILKMCFLINGKFNKIW